MRTIKLFLFGAGLMLAGSLHAQVSISVNLGSPPRWGPAGYSDVRYYYLPDIEAYYDIQASMFIYYNSGRWVHRSRLPVRYRNYDLYNGYKVVMSDYRGNEPYTHFKEYRQKYSKGYRGQEQRSIGDRPGQGNKKSYVPVRTRRYERTTNRQKENQGNSNNKKQTKVKSHGGNKEK